MSPLTPRQQEVLHLTSKGLCDKEVARELGIAAKTVKQHRYFARKVMGPVMYRRAVYRNAD